MLGKLFGSLFKGGSAAEAAPAAAATEDYKSCRIVAEPRQAGSQWQIAGRILKEIDGEDHEPRFIRADQLPTRDEAAEFTIRKAKLLIDQQGDLIFKS
ncbi:MAG: HlyU family transcriptional regulator [Pannonibacter phragmitetus]